MVQGSNLVNIEVLHKVKTGVSDSCSFEDWHFSLGLRKKPHGPYLNFNRVRCFYINSVFKRFLFLGGD